MWHGGGVRAIVAAMGQKMLIVKKMLNYKKSRSVLERPDLLKQQ